MCSNNHHVVNVLLIFLFMTKLSLKKTFFISKVFFRRKENNKTEVVEKVEEDEEVEEIKTVELEFTKCDY